MSGHRCDDLESRRDEGEPTRVALKPTACQDLPCLDEETPAFFERALRCGARRGNAARRVRRLNMYSLRNSGRIGGVSWCKVKAPHYVSGTLREERYGVCERKRRYVSFYMLQHHSAWLPGGVGA